MTIDPEKVSQNYTKGSLWQAEQTPQVGGALALRSSLHTRLQTQLGLIRTRLIQQPLCTHETEQEPWSLSPNPSPLLVLGLWKNPSQRRSLIREERNKREQRRRNSNSLVIKRSQGPSVPLQGL